MALPLARAVVSSATNAPATWPTDPPGGVGIRVIVEVSTVGTAASGTASAGSIRRYVADPGQGKARVALEKRVESLQVRIICSIIKSSPTKDRDPPCRHAAIPAAQKTLVCERRRSKKHVHITCVGSLQNALCGLHSMGCSFGSGEDHRGDTHERFLTPAPMRRRGLWHIAHLCDTHSPTPPHPYISRGYAGQELLAFLETATAESKTAARRSKRRVVGLSRG